MVKRAWWLTGLLAIGCGDPVVNWTYLGEPRLSGTVQGTSGGILMLAWLSASLQVEGTQTVPPNAETGDPRLYRFDIYDPPAQRYVHAFPQLIPGAELALGVWLWTVPSYQPLEFVNNVVQDGRLVSVDIEPIAYVADAGSTGLVAGSFYALPLLNCPADETGFVQTRHTDLFFPLAVDAGMPVTEWIPAKCASP